MSRVFSSWLAGIMVWGGRPQAKCHSHHLLSGAHTVKITCHCQYWPWARAELVSARLLHCKAAPVPGFSTAKLLHRQASPLRSCSSPLAPPHTHTHTHTLSSLEGSLCAHHTLRGWGSALPPWGQNISINYLEFSAEKTCLSSAICLFFQSFVYISVGSWIFIQFRATLFT